MTTLKDKIQNTFAAVAYAEAGEPAMAMEIAGIGEFAKSAARSALTAFDKIFSAITFAEADCHEYALEMMKEKKSVQAKPSLNDFLETIGLQGVRYSYVVAKV